MINYLTVFSCFIRSSMESMTIKAPVDKKMIMNNYQKNIWDMRPDIELSLTCPAHARAAVSHHGSAVGSVEHVDTSRKKRFWWNYKNN